MGTSAPAGLRGPWSAGRLHPPGPVLWDAGIRGLHLPHTRHGRSRWPRASRGRCVPFSKLEARLTQHHAASGPAASERIPAPGEAQEQTFCPAGRALRGLFISLVTLPPTWLHHTQQPSHRGSSASWRVSRDRECFPTHRSSRVRIRPTLCPHPRHVTSQDEDSVLLYSSLCVCAWSLSRV